MGEEDKNDAVADAEEVTVAPKLTLPLVVGQKIVTHEGRVVTIKSIDIDGDAMDDKGWYRHAGTGLSNGFEEYEEHTSRAMHDCPSWKPRAKRKAKAKGDGWVTHKPTATSKFPKRIVGRNIEMRLENGERLLSTNFPPEGQWTWTNSPKPERRIVAWRFMD